MSLRARLLAGVAAVALVLVVAGFASTRIVENYLIAGVDATLRDARFAGLGMGPMGRMPEGDRASPVYVGVVQGDAVETRFAPDLREGDPALPEIDGE